MKIRYFLKLTGGEHKVFLALYENEQTALISTGERCAPSAWDKKQREPKDQDSDVYLAIEKVKSLVLKAKKRLEVEEKTVTPFTLKDAYLKSQSEKTSTQHEHDKKNKVELATVSSKIEKYFTEGMDDDYQPNTKKNIKSSIRIFQAYLKSIGKSKITCAELNDELFNDYARYLGKRYLDSTHGKKTKDLKLFLKYIKYDKSPIEEIKTKNIKPSQRNKICLTERELTALENVDVSKSSERQKSKDMFLLGCYTGLRISDLKRINKDRIELGSICLTSKKTNKPIYIPVLSKLRAILERYDYGAPQISEQKVNENIKKVCDKAEIRTPIFFKSVKKGTLLETKFKKFEKITTHSAGKTFISLAGKMYGLMPSEIAAIVGKDIKTVLEFYLSADVVTESAREKMIEADNRAQMKVAG